MSGRYGTITDAQGRKWDFEPIDNTSRGEPDGLFGINCGHSFRYIEEGAFINREKQTPDDSRAGEENKKQYAQSQEQRSIEREIRKYERESELLKEAGLNDFAKIPAGNARSVRDEYRAFCEETGRTPRWDRTRIY
jgi:hypothetical protein